MADKEKVEISMEKGFKTIPATVKPNILFVVSIYMMMCILFETTNNSYYF